MEDIQILTSKLRYELSADKLVHINSHIRRRDQLADQGRLDHKDLNSPGIRTMATPEGIITDAEAIHLQMVRQWAPLFEIPAYSLPALAGLEPVHE